MLNKNNIIQAIEDKIIEADNDFTTSDVSIEYLEAYKAGLKHAKIILEEFESMCL